MALELAKACFDPMVALGKRGAYLWQRDDRDHRPEVRSTVLL